MTTLDSSRPRPDQLSTALRSGPRRRPVGGGLGLPWPLEPQRVLVGVRVRGKYAHQYLVAVFGIVDGIARYDAVRAQAFGTGSVLAA